MESQVGPNMRANSSNYNYYSEFSLVSFNGFINENYFSVKVPEKNLYQNLDISHAITRNIFNYKQDGFLGLILKSKFDGIGKREPIDLSIALDISGSMFCTDENNSKNRLTLAIEALKKLISIMNENDDRMALITFNQKTQKIFDLSKKSDIEKNHISKLDNIKAQGGTNLLDAAIVAMDNLNSDDNKDKNKRIILITDAYYDDASEELFNLIKINAEEMHVPVTVLAISSESNMTLADKLCHFRGCNYFTVAKSDDLDNYLVQNFNYIFFPITYDTKLTISSQNAKIIKCIGGDNVPLDEAKNKYNDNQEEAPIPLGKIEFNLGTCFSSKMIQYKNINYSLGGLILLKIDPEDIKKDEDLKFDISLEYNQYDNNAKSCQNYTYIIKKEEKTEDYFKNENIKKGITLYYYVNALNYLVESEKEKKINKDKKNKEKDMKLLETRQVVKDYLDNNFGNEPDIEKNKNLLNNYKKLMEERYNEFRKFIIIFYDLNAAPPIF